MIILEDTRQQAGKHDKKHEYFAQHGIKIERCKLYCGDYTLPTNQKVCIDTKKDIQELIGDICGKQHERFRRECMRAKESGIRLIVLVENSKEWVCKSKNIYNTPVRSIQDLFHWVNKRSFIWKNGKQAYPNATKGGTLAKACMTMEAKYGVEFRFCLPEESGKIIVDILTGAQYE